MDETVIPKAASSPGTTQSAGTKRKRNAEPKFYAVRVGYHPGIYHTWADCLKQVKGFKKATFKSFSSLTDAERFLAGENPVHNVGLLSPTSSKFYAVKSGRIPGIYTDWPSAQAQITGWTKPRHKCFATRIEAQRFLNEEESKSTEAFDGNAAEHDLSAIQDALVRPDETMFKPAATKRTKRAINGNTRNSKTGHVEYNESDYQPGTGPLPPGMEDGFDSNIFLDPETGQVMYKTEEQRQATKIQMVPGGQTDPIRIYTDGSALGNGGPGAFAGVGVYFGPGDPRNVSEALPGARQTNQRAELTAILRALEVVPRNRDVTIVTDSRYAIDCVTSWCITWRKNGWKTAAGKAVENKDLIESILHKIEDRQGFKMQTKFEWIKGHANHDGNVEADKLAVDGARKASYM